MARLSIQARRLKIAAELVGLARNEFSVKTETYMAGKGDQRHKVYGAAWLHVRVPLDEKRALRLATRLGAAGYRCLVTEYRDHSWHLSVTEDYTDPGQITIYRGGAAGAREVFTCEQNQLLRELVNEKANKEDGL